MEEGFLISLHKVLHGIGKALLMGLAAGVPIGVGMPQENPLKAEGGVFIDNFLKWTKLSLVVVMRAFTPS